MSHGVLPPYFGLVVVDMNRDFVGGAAFANAALPVGGADALVEPMEALFMRLNRHRCKLALFTRDTHFAGEYEKSPESVPFPNIHCEVGTPGHDLAVSPRLLERVRIPTFFLNKNVFDTWGTQHTGASEVDVPADQRLIYRNLFQITDPSGTAALSPRDVFFNNMKRHGIFTLVVCGVATDYCVLMFVIGALARGFHVILLSDLVRHIVYDLETLLDMAPTQIAAHLNPGTDAASLLQRQQVVDALSGKTLREHTPAVTTSDKI